MDRGAVEIGPDEREVVLLFFAMATQWRWHPVLGLRLGLIYEAAAPTAAGIGVTMTPALFADLRTMEDAALAASADRHG